MKQPVNIYVKLPGDVADALIRLALSEWRRPRDQAALLLAEGLRNAGALPAETVAAPKRADTRTAVAAT